MIYSKWPVVCDCPRKRSNELTKHFQHHQWRNASKRQLLPLVVTQIFQMTLRYHWEIIQQMWRKLGWKTGAVESTANKPKRVQHSTFWCRYEASATQYFVATTNMKWTKWCREDDACLGWVKINKKWHKMIRSVIFSKSPGQKKIGRTCI